MDNSNKYKTKVAIHNPDFIGSFSSKWIEYCSENKIDFFVINCFDNDVITVLKENKATHLLWHFGQVWRDLLNARNILYSAQQTGIKVFPDFHTSWHFDDKITQKYLLEATGINLVKTYVFFDKISAKSWRTKEDFHPLVAKLRRGSGSTSVLLIKSYSQFNKYLNRMFSKGISPVSSLKHDFLRRTKSIKSFTDAWLITQKLYKRFHNKIMRIHEYPKEVGYVYFQEFIPDCSYDIRIIVIGHKAFGIKRIVRKNDFRASGSGNIIYDSSQISIECIKKGFDISEKLHTQCVAIDFLTTNNGSVYVIEISYGFSPRAYDFCEGYWDKNLVFYKCNPILEYEIIEGLLQDYK